MMSSDPLHTLDALSPCPRVLVIGAWIPPSPRGGVTEPTARIAILRILAHDGSISAQAVDRGLVVGDVLPIPAPAAGNVISLERDHAQDLWRWRPRYPDPAPFLGSGEPTTVILNALWGLTMLSPDEWSDGPQTARSLRGLVTHADERVRREAALLAALWSL